MVCHWKEPAAALQIRENAISPFSMKGLEPLLEQACKVHVGLLHVFQAKGRATQTSVIDHCKDGSN